MLLTQSFVKLYTTDGVFVAPEYSGTVAELCYPRSTRVVRTSRIHYLIYYLNERNRNIVQYCLKFYFGMRDETVKQDTFGQWTTVRFGIEIQALTI